MPNKIKQLLVLSACAIFLACGDSTNERGIASTTSDSTASGSAYKSSDGFAPAAAPVASQSPATTVSAPVAPVDSTATTATTTVSAPVTTATAATAAGATPKPATPAVAAAKPAATSNNADIKKGEALISKSDCLACHKVDAKLLGPSYKEVAAKYANNASTVSQLANKIKSGGSGVWGAVPMSPHPALSDDDAKAMVRYILSLK
ncbi:MAG: c-type cytochrome [Daejeonella sp.]|uniref:c-type cytochrome n=1 Tax=Daejeonella sp. TaxID=2805397 RepID=UPI003C743891